MGYKAYQLLNFHAPEWDVVVSSPFRYGNVPCGYPQREALQRALQMLNPGIEKVRIRMDTQGYEWKLLRYLAQGHNERFGVMEFAVGADVTVELSQRILVFGGGACRIAPPRCAGDRRTWPRLRDTGAPVVARSVLNLLFES